jgi:DNA-binding NarL/FixJ family response regulator
MGVEPPHEPGLIETLAAGIAHEVRNPETKDRTFTPFFTTREDGAAAVRALFVVATPLGASDLLILRRIRQTSPQTGIVVFARSPTNPDLKLAFESGATAFLSWPASKEAVRQAVESGGVPTGQSSWLRS